MKYRLKLWDSDPIWVKNTCKASKGQNGGYPIGVEEGQHYLEGSLELQRYWTLL